MNVVQRNEWSYERRYGWEQESLAGKQDGCDLCRRITIITRSRVVSLPMRQNIHDI